ncbi:MAG: hypothetical protein ACLQKA_25135 [Bryobacteraceae bacterium]
MLGIERVAFGQLADPLDRVVGDHLFSLAKFPGDKGDPMLGGEAERHLRLAFRVSRHAGSQPAEELLRHGELSFVAATARAITESMSSTASQLLDGAASTSSISGPGCPVTSVGHKSMYAEA